MALPKKRDQSLKSGCLPALNFRARSFVTSARYLPTPGRMIEMSNENGMALTTGYCYVRSPGNSTAASV